MNTKTYSLFVIIETKWSTQAYNTESVESIIESIIEFNSSAQKKIMINSILVKLFKIQIFYYLCVDIRIIFRAKLIQKFMSNLLNFKTFKAIIEIMTKRMS